LSRRILKGLVSSIKCNKTITVEVYRRFMHPLYKKFITRSKKFLAHDPNNSCNIGDRVCIRECRPISKRKSWELMEVKKND